MYKRYGLILFTLALLTPLGLLADGTAWGEWEAQAFTEKIGFIPQGMEQLKDFWTALFPDYSINFLGKSTLGLSAGYILSAILGSAVVFAVVTLAGRLLISKKKPICTAK
jgi:hypothetical protein